MKNKQVIKVQNFKENFWKRRIVTAVATQFENGFKYKVELYSLNKSFLGSRVIHYYQLEEELIGLGFKGIII